MSKSVFLSQDAVADVEEGERLAPKFDAAGVLPAVATDADSGEVVMLAYMNAQALRKTIETGEAYYWSRSRGELWHKGATSGHVQKVEELRIDCDQDAVWLKVRVGGTGASCHVGYKSCFFRRIPLGTGTEVAALKLDLAEAEKRFDPAKVYGKK